MLLLSTGRIPGFGRVGGRVPIGVEVEKQARGGVHVRLASRPAGELQQQSELSGQAGETRAATGR